MSSEADSNTSKEGDQDFDANRAFQGAPYGGSDSWASGASAPAGVKRKKRAELENVEDWLSKSIYHV